MSVGIVVVGSLNLDRTYTLPALPREGESLHSTHVMVSSGGKGANQAVAAAKLGAHVTLVGAVGADSAADEVLNAVSRAGVDTSVVARVAGESTGEAVILVDAAGRNTIIVSSGANAHARMPQQSSLPRARVVVGGFEVSDEAVIGAAKFAASIGAKFVLNPSPFRALPDAIRVRVDVLVVNEHELAQAVGASIDTEVDAALTHARADLGVAQLVVTLGASGAVVVSDRVARVPALRVDAVDTSGAGDAFLGGLVARLADDASIEDAVRFGVAVGGYAATRPGTQLSYPTLAELNAWRAWDVEERNRP